MATFILTWNPMKWQWDHADYQRKVELTARGKTVNDRWSVGNRRSGLVPGDRGFLLRQDIDRGIIASGHFTSQVYQDVHWDGSGRDANYADLVWDTLLEATDRLPIEILKARVASFSNRIQAGGVELPATAAAELERLWAEHLGGVLFHSPDEPAPDGRYTEGAVVRVEMNRYERDRAARKACIAHWGTACVVCGLDFAATYGTLGSGFIHVHHLRELSTVGPGYQVDPVADLRPICPNCHAMLHRQRPALKPAALKKRLATKKARIAKP